MSDEEPREAGGPRPAAAADLRRRLLAARDARQALVSRLVGEDRGRTVIFLSLNVPGADKNLPGLDRIFARARASLLDGIPGCEVVARGSDALGAWLAAACGLGADAAKRQCIDLEESSPQGRLVDLDVFAGDGRQVDRRALNRPARRCLVCPEPSFDCMRLGRHTPGELSAAVALILRDAR